MKERLIALLYTSIFALAMILLGDWMIGHSSIVSTQEHQNLLSRGGMILSWMGALSVLLTVWELVLWPWYSIKGSFDQHKDDPAFAGRLAYGWCVMCGLLIHALFWSSA